MTWLFPTDVRFGDYEYGRLLACTGDTDGARRHLELILSGLSRESMQPTVLASDIDYQANRWKLPEEPERYVSPVLYEMLFS